MARGRSGAGKTMVIGLSLLLLTFLHSNDALTHFVGESGGWTFGFADNYSGSNVWSLCIGDILDFKYDASKYNVVEVNTKSFFSCRPQLGARIYKSGHEIFTIKKGNNIFISGVPGHCEKGMKLAVNGMNC